jgi:IPT/TIG domain-containing protein
MLRVSARRQPSTRALRGRAYSALLVLALCAAVAYAPQAYGQVPIELVVSNATVPPGGMLQFTVSLTEPQPIRRGTPVLAFASTLLGPAQGLSIYSLAGDAIGAAVVRGGNVKMIVNSAQLDYGMDLDAPVVAISIPVLSTALPGQTVNLNLNPNSIFLDPNGNPYPTLVTQGMLTVGGTLSISNIVPGGGVAPVGSIVKILGMGFQTDSKVNINNALISSTHFVSSNEIDVVLAADTQMDGQRVRVENPSSKEMAVYYSYLRTKPLGKSAFPLLAKTAPLFSQALYQKGYFRTVAGTTYLGVAAQNANAQSANITIKLFSATNTLLGSTSVSLPPAMRFSRSVWELFPNVTPTNNLIVKMVSDIPVGMLGLLADTYTKTVAPLAPTSTP